MKQVKGASSFQINRLNIAPNPFYWQTGYGAFSVSLFGLSRVREYIERQREHHAIRPYLERVKDFLNDEGLGR